MEIIDTQDIDSILLPEGSKFYVEGMKRKNP